jgi:hypothetical protein
MIAKYSDKICCVFLTITLVLFYFGMIDTGCIFAWLTWLTWPLDPAPEPGSRPLKDRV